MAALRRIMETNYGDCPKKADSSPCTGVNSITALSIAGRRHSGISACADQSAVEARVDLCAIGVVSLQGARRPCFVFRQRTSGLRSYSHPHLVAAANQPGRFDGFGTFCISKISFFVWVAHRQPEQDSVRLSGAEGISAQFRHRSVAVANPNT